jgi:hypothetical protein
VPACHAGQALLRSSVTIKRAAPTIAREDYHGATRTAASSGTLGQGLYHPAGTSGRVKPSLVSSCNNSRTSQAKARFILQEQQDVSSQGSYHPAGTAGRLKPDPVLAWLTAMSVRSMLIDARMKPLA